MTDIDALRKVAEEARHWLMADGSLRLLEWHTAEELEMGDLDPVHAAYIAAANPTAVLDLLDRMRAAEAAVARCRALHSGEHVCAKTLHTSAWHSDTNPCATIRALDGDA